MKNWAKIGESKNGIDLEIQKSILHENCEIEAIIVNNKVSAYDLGNWELFVHESEADRAKLYLSNLPETTAS
jgi:hypothetical protein